MKKFIEGFAVGAGVVIAVIATALLFSPPVEQMIEEFERASGE